MQNRIVTFKGPGGHSFNAFGAPSATHALGRAIAKIAEVYRWRGTVRGLRAELAIYTGGEVEISETGAVMWSRTPGSVPPGEDVPRLAVRVRVRDPKAINLRTVDQMISSSKPAHVAHVVEIVKQ